jgi:aspartyl-tRNA(Asn)/glutamyl-tRNA(Gln) amidotransferase subunit A
MIAYASSLDQAGFLTKTVEDSALLFNLTNGIDGKDSTLVNLPKQDFSQISKGVKGKTIGIPKEFEMDGIDPQIVKAWADARKKLELEGANIIEVSLPHAMDSIKAYYFISTAEASSNLARYDGIKYGHRTQKDFKTIEEIVSHSRAEGFGTEVKNRILVGTRNLLSDSYKENYERILKLRRIIKYEFEQVFQKCDAILCPTTPNLAPTFNQTQTELEEYINDILTVPVNIAGLPAISVPFGKGTCGRPIGMQVITKAYNEKTLFEVALSLES